MNRREALRHLLVFSASGVLAACSKSGGSKPTCTDTAGLTPDEVTMRNTTAAYVETTTDPGKPCSTCVQYVAGPSCGTCKVVKGPINPAGSCKLWVAKPA